MPSHLQEFVMLEWYCAYENYMTGVEWTKQIIRRGMEQSLGTTVCETIGKDNKKESVDFSKDIPMRTFQEVIDEYGIDMFADRDVLVKKAGEIGLNMDTVKTKDRAGLLDEIFKKQIRPEIIHPLIVIDYPSDLFPLARRKEDNPAVSESYQLIVQGSEIVKGYSEIS